MLHYFIPTIQGKIKKSYRHNNIEISVSIWNDDFELPDGSNSASDIKDYFQYILKTYETLTDNSPIRIYVTKLKTELHLKLRQGTILKF